MLKSHAGGVGVAERVGLTAFFFVLGGGGLLHRRVIYYEMFVMRIQKALICSTNGRNKDMRTVF
jgi:hypothetical protein